jgi:hypothetical protein
MKRCLPPLLLCCCMLLMTASGFGQNLTGSQITNETANELTAYALTQMSSQNIQAALQYSAGLQNPADVTAALSALQTFNTQYSASIASFNAAQNQSPTQNEVTSNYNSFTSANTAATNSLMSTLAGTLTTNGYAAFQAFVANQQSANIVLSPDYYSNLQIGCSSPIMAGFTVRTFTPINSGAYGSVNVGVTTGGVANSRCGGTASYTATARTQNYGSASQTISGNMQDYLSVSVVETVILTASDPCNAVVNENDPFCEDQSAGDGDDSDGGNYGVSYGTPWEFATTVVTYNGTKSNCSTGASGITWCDFNVNNWCTASTTPPDNNMNGQNIWWTMPGSAEWKTISFCWSSNFNALGQAIQPFTCSYGWAIAQGAGPQGICDSHPY